MSSRFKTLIENIGTYLGDEFFLHENHNTERVPSKTQVEGIIHSTIEAMDNTTERVQASYETITIDFLIPCENLNDKLTLVNKVVNMIQATNQTEVNDEETNNRFLLYWTNTGWEGGVQYVNTTKHIHYFISANVVITDAFISSNNLEIKVSEDGTNWKGLGGVLSFSPDIKHEVLLSVNNGENTPEITSKYSQAQIAIKGYLLSSEACNYIYKRINTPSNLKNALYVKYSWGLRGTASLITKTYKCLVLSINPIFILGKFTEYTLVLAETS